MNHTYPIHVYVSAVNCDWRLVFCNTLGIIPFKFQDSVESAASHKQLEKMFYIRSLERVWLVGQEWPFF